MSFLTAPLFRIVTILLLALTALLAPSAPAGAREALVVATYNVRGGSTYTATVTDLRALLTEADAVVLQEVGSDGKKEAIDQVRSESKVCPTHCRVLYSPGAGDEAILWHPDKLVLKAKGSAKLSDPTAVGNPSVTIGTRYLTWGSFVLNSTISTSPAVGTIHLVARPHIDDRRAALLQLEVQNLAKAIKNLGFKKPLIGGDFNVDYNDPWLQPLRDIGMLNDDEYFAASPYNQSPLATFYNTSDGQARSFDEWWFYPASQTGLTPTEHHTCPGPSDNTCLTRSSSTSDHWAVIVSFSVQ